MPVSKFKRICVRYVQLLSNLVNLLWRAGVRRGTWQRNWLRQYATIRKVTCFTPDELIAFFNLPNSSSRTMAMESTQPLTEMSTRNVLETKVRLPTKCVDIHCRQRAIIIERSNADLKKLVKVCLNRQMIYLPYKVSFIVQRMYPSPTRFFFHIKIRIIRPP
jgi:hypothetical protein